MGTSCLMNIFADSKTIREQQIPAFKFSNDCGRVIFISVCGSCHDICAVSLFQNSPFIIPWLGLKGLANISRTSMSMYELVKNCCSNLHTPDMYASSNSYHFFLRILTQVMKKAVNTNGVHPWKQIKGRYNGFGSFFSMHWELSITEPF